MKEKAAVDMKREQAEMVITLAGRLIDENLDDKKNRSLTDKLIKEF